MLVVRGNAVEVVLNQLMRSQLSRLHRGVNLGNRRLHYIEWFGTGSNLLGNAGPVANPYDNRKGEHGHTHRP